MTRIPTEMPSRRTIGIPSPKPTPRPTFVVLLLFCGDGEDIAVAEPAALLDDGAEEIDVLSVLGIVDIGALDIIDAKLGATEDDEGEADTASVILK